MTIASRKPQAASRKPQAASRKPQAASRKPQAARVTHPRRSRPRFPHRLPVLALLLGALSLFAAAPAEAQRTIPTVPQNVVLTPGDGKLTLSWEAPSAWGDFPATGYQIDWRTGGAMSTATWIGAGAARIPNQPTTATRYEFTGTYGGTTVTNGTEYGLRIRAFSTSPTDPSDTLPSNWVTVYGTPAATTTPAEAQTIVWSATLTPQDLSGGSFGCRTTGSSACSVTSVLSEDEFTHGSEAYMIRSITLATSGGLAGTLYINFNKALPSSFRNMTLHVGSSRLRLGDGTFSGSTGEVSWSSSGLTWTANTPVELKLTLSVPPPTVWSAELTPQDLSGGSFGCRTTGSSACSVTSVLSEDEFTHGRETYMIRSITLATSGGLAGTLYINFSKALPSSFRNMTLHVGSSRLRLGDGTFSGSTGEVSWSSSGLTWTANTPVQLSLTAPATHPLGPVPGTPVLSVGTTTATTLSFGMQCVSSGLAPVTDYVLRAVNKADDTEVHWHYEPGPYDYNTHCYNTPAITATLMGLKPGTTYTVRAFARNLFGRQSPLSAAVESTTDAMQIGGGFHGQHEAGAQPPNQGDPQPPDQGADPPPGSGQPVEDLFEDLVLTPPAPYDELISEMYGWRNDPQYVRHKSHTDRLDRVLLAFGERVADATLMPMTPAQAQKWADEGWDPWIRMAAALRAIVTGTSGPDTLTGTGDGDFLVGLGGADTLSGQGGNDELRGGDGDDDLTGGAGADRFVFLAGETGAKAITDFASGDVIVLKGGSWSSAADIVATVQAVGSAGYRYTLASGLTVETTNNRTLRTENFLVE